MIYKSEIPFKLPKLVLADFIRATNRRAHDITRTVNASDEWIETIFSIPGLFTIGRGMTAYQEKPDFFIKVDPDVIQGYYKDVSEQDIETIHNYMAQCYKAQTNIHAQEHARHTR